MNPLVGSWQDAADSFKDCVRQLPDEAFSQPSGLPNWTIGDIVAHVVALEAELAGWPMPQHEPDWDALPHADDLFSRYTEVGVDYRRGRTPEELRKELDEVLATRSQQLADGPQDPDGVVAAIGGVERTFDEMLRMRTFDIFLHELDIRDALDMPPPELGQAAGTTVDVMAGALGYVWVKKAGAQPGDVLHFVVPDWQDRWIGVGEDGRGREIEPGEPTVSITADVLPYIRLASGRDPDMGTVAVEGDMNLGSAVLANLNVAP